jgi:hypothetical protein
MAIYTLVSVKIQIQAKVSFVVAGIYPGQENLCFSLVPLVIDRL